ncbi:hypothetical protein U9R90_25020 [Streptomyces sp. E11-3]|uniref:hypothetical protein n=1 Tax=Streptomyces sp. E11-3 TaxID=3110112 RepID=UPI00397F0FE6
MAAEKQPAEGPEPSRLAGGCVLALLTGVAFTIVFALSYVAGVLAVWSVSTAVLWWTVRRRMSDSSATPPPRGVVPSGDVYAGETGDIARVVQSPEGVMCILHPVREEEVNNP